MKEKNEDFQPQFRGFFNTPHLFLNPVFDLQPFTKRPDKDFVFNGTMPENIRLGQRVERFVSSELLQLKNIEILSENYQVRNEKITIGELDCLCLEDGNPIHLEIQFKYYLYDESLGETEIDHCVGPMRRDTLNEKLDKLKNKQLPLLYAKETKPLLEQLKLKAADLTQYIYFKAQLFIPFGKQITLKTLNNDCIYGFYFNYTDLNQFEDCKFYKPKKTDWLLDLDTNVNWLTYEQITQQLDTYKAENYAPMLWLKYPKGEMNKCFVVPW